MIARGNQEAYIAEAEPGGDGSLRVQLVLLQGVSEAEVVLEERDGDDRCDSAPERRGIQSRLPPHGRFVERYWKLEDTLDANCLILDGIGSSNEGKIEDGATIVGRTKIGEGATIFGESVVRGSYVSEPPAASFAIVLMNPSCFARGH